MFKITKGKINHKYFPPNVPIFFEKPRSNLGYRDHNSSDIQHPDKTDRRKTAMTKSF